MYLHEELTDKIIRCFYNVYNGLGYGFLEKVYESAFYLEILQSGLQVIRQSKIQVFYEGYEVGEYFADLLVEGIVIIEIKATVSLVEEHERQLINYLKATDKEVGLMMNFGKKPEFIRISFSQCIEITQFFEKLIRENPHNPRHPRHPRSHLFA